MSILSKPLKMYNQVYPQIDHIRGTHRLRMFLKKLAMINTGKTLTSEILGTNIQVPTENNQGFMISHGYGDFGELDDIQYIIDEVEEGDKFLDIGSSYGLYSFIIDNRTEADVKSIEALPENTAIQRLTKNLYNYEVDILNAAASNKSGTAQLNVSGNSKGQNSLKGSKSSEINVRSVRVDDLDFVPDYVKIDVEGAEMDVLQGMENTLKENQVKIVLELHPDDHLSLFNTSQKEVVDYLYELGYRLDSHSEEDHHFSQQFSGQKNVNAVFSKKEP